MSRVADLTGQRVLVTGASSGIGAGMAEEFARRGAAVGICARRKDRLEEVLARCQAHSPTSRMWLTDMTDAGAVGSLAASALEELGGVDILVNNAGIPKRRKVTSLDPGTVQAVMNVNYFAAVNLTLALLPSMLAQKQWPDCQRLIHRRHAEPVRCSGRPSARGCPARGYGRDIRQA